MKKILTLLCLIIMCLFTFAESSNAASENLQGFVNPDRIKVYIPPNKNATMMKHAFEEWQRLTNNRIRFYFVNDPKISKMDVYFVDKINTRNMAHLSRALGVAESRKAKRIHHVNIEIATYTQNGRPLSKDEIYTVMLHEIGHGLGLGHSKNRNSIMYPQAYTHLEIIQEDLNNLKRIYNWN